MRIVVSVKQFFGPVGARNAQEIFIKPLNIWVIMGLAKRFMLIDTIKDFRTFLAIFLHDVFPFSWMEIGFNKGLATAIDASAGAPHDFNKSIGGFACFDLF